MCIWILMIHCYKLMGTNETMENMFYLQGPHGSGHCNTRKMSWSLLHGIISKCPPRRWCLLFCHVVFLLKNISEKRRSGWWFLSTVSLPLFCLCLSVSFSCPFNLCFLVFGNLISQYHIRQLNHQGLALRFTSTIRIIFLFF